MKLLLCLFLATAAPAFALETDNYLSWLHELPDASEDLNLFFHTQIEEVLASAPEKKNLTCEQVTFRIAEKFKTGVKGEVFVNWSTKDISQKIFPSTDSYLEQSIYRETPVVLLKHAPLAPNIQTGGIYFGIDKLSHFASTGRRYFKEYLKKIRKGYSSLDAENAAIHLGLSNEAGILGIWASGVFSYGDLEANYQGLRFYRKFCHDQQDTYLTQVNGRWKLAKVPDIRDYVTPYWDETFNLSYREPRTWAVASKILLEEYCPMKDNKDILSRFKFYQSVAKKSRSIEYIEELQTSETKQAPVPSKNQSFEELCKKGKST